MNQFAIALVLSSTVMHAAWNLLVRGQADKDVFILRMLLAVTAAGLVPALLGLIFVYSFPLSVWGYAAGSGVFCGLYFFSLARSYSSEDFTVVYPIARALPVLIVALGDVLRGRYPSGAGWLGMSLVALGCVLIPLSGFTTFSARRYWNRATPWLLLTALGTVGYTLLDKIASEQVTPGPLAAGLYEYVFFMVTAFCYTLALKPAKLKQGLSDVKGWAIPGLAAAFNFGAYLLVLWAYQLTSRASYIVAFRQFSIVIGVLLAFYIFKEKGRAVRLTGTFLITAGLIIIGLWGSEL